MVWRKLPTAVLKQRHSIGTYKQLLQNQVRLFSTTVNNNNNNNDNNSSNNNDDNNNENDDDGNLMNLAMQNMKNNNKINNNGNNNISQTSGQDELVEESVSESELESEEEGEGFLDANRKENGDLMTENDEELTDLSYDYDASEDDNIRLENLRQENDDIVSKNEKVVKVEFIKAFSFYSNNPDIIQEEAQGEQPEELAQSSLTDSNRNEILSQFIQNYRSKGEELYRQYIKAEQVGDFGLLKKDYVPEFPPYVDRVNGNIMVYDGNTYAYKYYSNIYSNDADRFSNEQILRTRFFKDDNVVISKYLMASPPEIRNAIFADEKLFEQVIRIIHIDQRVVNNQQNGPEIDFSKHAEVIARAAKETGLISEELANQMYGASSDSQEFHFMDNASNFYNSQVERSKTNPPKNPSIIDTAVEGMKIAKIARDTDINFAPDFSLDGIRGQQLKDQLSQYYLERSKREMPKPVTKVVEAEETQDNFKPIPAGYEMYDAPVEDVLPNKPVQIDNFNPDFYKDFIQYRVLAMPHENLRMQEAIDAFEKNQEFQSYVTNDIRIKRDEVQFFMENYLNEQYDVDFNKIQKDLESLYYKPLVFNTSSSKSSTTSTSQSKSSSSVPSSQIPSSQVPSKSTTSTNNTYITADKGSEDILNPSIVTSVLAIQDLFKDTKNKNDSNNNNDDNSNTIKNDTFSSDKIGNIELNDQDDAPLSELYTIPTDLDNPSEQDDTNIDAELFLDSDETLTNETGAFQSTATYDEYEQEFQQDQAQDQDLTYNQEAEEFDQDEEQYPDEFEEDEEYSEEEEYEEGDQSIQQTNSEEITPTEEYSEEFTEQTEEGQEQSEEGEQEGEEGEQESEESEESEKSEDFSEKEITEIISEDVMTFREEGKGVRLVNDMNDPFLDDQIGNDVNKEGDAQEELPQYLDEADELFVRDMEEYTDSLFLTVDESTEDNVVTFGELDEDDVLLSGDNDVGFSEEDRKLVPFAVDFEKIQDEIDAARSSLSKEDLLQSIKEEFGVNYYEGIAHDKLLKELKEGLPEESFESLMEILESPTPIVEGQEEELPADIKKEIEEIKNEIRELNGFDENDQDVSVEETYEDDDEEYDDEVSIEEYDDEVSVEERDFDDVDEYEDDEDVSLEEGEEEEDDELVQGEEDGIGFKLNEEEGDLDLVHPEGIQQFEDAVEEMELFDLMEGTYEEDLDLLRAEADMYVRRNEKKMKVLAKRRAFAKQMRDKQLEQNKINPPVRVPYTIPTIPSGKNIYTSVLAPPNSYLKLQNIRNQPKDKQAHKQIIEESYRALSSNAFYGVKEAEFAVKKINKELGNAEGYKKYRKHSKLNSKAVENPILSKPDLMVQPDKLHDFNPLYRNN